MKKKTIINNIAIILSLSVITGSMPLSQITLVSAAGKTALSARKMTLAVGGKKTLKLKNNKKKTTWRITAGKKYIRLKNKVKNSVKIVGIKAGTARVQVKAGKAKYACKVIVKAKANPNASEQATLAPQLIVPVPDAPVVPVNPPVTQQPNLAVTLAPQSTEEMATEAPIESIQPAESAEPTNLPEKSFETKETFIPSASSEVIVLPEQTVFPTPDVTETPNVSDLPQKTVSPEPTGNNHFEGYIGKCADISDKLQVAECDEEGYIQMTDIRSTDKNVSDTMITNEEDVWVNCGDKTIKELEKSFSFYFEQSDVTYSVTYIDECCQESRIENEPDNVGFLKLQAIRTMEDGSVWYKNYYIIKQVHAFVSFSGRANGIALDGEEFETYDKTYCLYDFEGNVYRALEIGKKYDVYIPFDVLDMGDDVIVGSYKADCVKRDAAVYESDFEIVKKDSGDVAALKNLIQQQKNAGASLENNINVRSNYDWKDGRLIKIQWDCCYLRGEISFSDFSVLQTIDCAGNSLTQIDVSGNKALSNFSCGENKISQLDISNNTALTELSCNDNKLSELNLEENKQLETLNCESNKLTQLDLSKNGKISWLNIASNLLSTIDVSNLVDLQTLICSGNILKEISLTNNTVLRTLECSNNQITSLNLERNILLEDLKCGYNSLTKLEVESNKALKIINCEKNNLTDLDVSKNIILLQLSCSMNHLTELDLSSQKYLTGLWCNSNNLSDLTVSDNVELTWLECCVNNLKDLDISANNKLTGLWCSSNQILNLNISNNRELNSFLCDENVTVIGRENTKLD